MMVQTRDRAWARGSARAAVWAMAREGALETRAFIPMGAGLPVSPGGGSAAPRLLADDAARCQRTTAVAPQQTPDRDCHGRTALRRQRLELWTLHGRGGPHVSGTAAEVRSHHLACAGEGAAHGWPRRRRRWPRSGRGRGKPPGSGPHAASSRRGEPAAVPGAGTAGRARHCTAQQRPRRHYGTRPATVQQGCRPGTTQDAPSHPERARFAGRTLTIIRAGRRWLSSDAPRPCNSACARSELPVTSLRGCVPILSPTALK
jgi:hypothetical protein